MKFLDTCFLIDLQKEWAKQEQGVATGYLNAHREEEFAVSVVAVLEFLEGYDELADGERFLAPFRQVEISSKAARIGSRVRRSLRKSGLLICDFDILIASTAIEAGVSLVTDNSRHFQRIEGLRVESYR
jgi:predicted nucleic acid-binding protein